MPKARLLIVEDELIVAQDLRNRLKRLGYEVVGSTTTGEQAIALADELRPDLVLMDIRLEGEMDGIVAATRIRRDSRLPIVFLTAYSEDDTLERAKSAQPLGYVLKPFEDRELKTVIEMGRHKHRADEEIRRLQCLYATLSEVNQAIVRFDTAEELFRALVQIAVEYGRFEAARLDVIDRERGTLIRKAHAGAEFGPVSVPLSLDFPLPACAHALRDAAASGSPRRCNHLEVPSPPETRVRSVAAVPFRFQGEIAGVIGLAAGEPDFFQTAEAQLVEEIALDVSFALERFEAIARRHRAEVALAVRARQQATVAELGQRALEGTDPGALFQLALDRGTETLGVEFGSVMEPTSDGTAIRLIAGTGWKDGEVGRLEVATGRESQTGYALLSREPVVVVELGSESRFTPSRAMLDHGITSGVTVLIGRPDQPFGALGLHTRQPRTFSPDDVNFVQAMANVLAEAVARKRTEQVLREQEDRYRGLFEGLTDAVVVQGLGDDGAPGRFLAVNTHACQRLGYSREELLQRTLQDLTAPESKVDLNAVAGRLSREGKVLFEQTLVAKDGRRIPVETHVQGVSMQGRQVLLSVIRDVTERQRAEAERDRLQAQLVQARKMESVGRLAGGVAHDFNNMLQAILGNVVLALQDLPADSPIRESLEEIQKSTLRSADLTRQLLAFARRQTIAPKVLDLNETVTGMLKLLRRLIGEEIELTWVPGDDLWPIQMDPSQIDQILANLCVNARDAIGGVGTVTIETGNRTLSEGLLRSQPDAAPGDYVMLAVSDTGHGMDECTRSRLFEPFFTTKEMGKGTGLGLATVFGIVKQNQGIITVESQPDRGTRFTLYLPRTDSQPADHSVPRTARGVRGSETILLVEDETQVLRLAQRILIQQGYTVLAARTPDAALELATRHSGPIHLLVSDVVMPGMNGRELYQRLRLRTPDLRCLYMSGYTDDAIAHHGVLNPGVHFLQKPFSIESLAQSARQAIESPAGPCP